MPEFIGVSSGKLKNLRILDGHWVLSNEEARFPFCYQWYVSGRTLNISAYGQNRRNAVRVHVSYRAFLRARAFRPFLQSVCTDWRRSRSSMVVYDFNVSGPAGLLPTAISRVFSATLSRNWANSNADRTDTRTHQTHCSVSHRYTSTRCCDVRSALPHIAQRTRPTDMRAILFSVLSARTSSAGRTNSR